MPNPVRANHSLLKTSPFLAFITLLLFTALLPAGSASAQDLSPWKQEVVTGVENRTKLVQEMVDSIFSFAEPGFQEFRTSQYITDILKDNGFAVEHGISGIPTAWKATWGNGEPVIALGSDIDALLGLSQAPGVTGNATFSARCPWSR